jgi:hypothetical protein
LPRFTSRALNPRSPPLNLIPLILFTMSTLFDTTLGALFIGVFVSAMCVLHLSWTVTHADEISTSISIYGITFLQVFMYFTSFSKKDRLYLKAFIAALWYARHVGTRAALPDQIQGLWTLLTWL